MQHCMKLYLNVQNQSKTQGERIILWEQMCRQGHKVKRLIVRLLREQTSHFKSKVTTINNHFLWKSDSGSDGNWCSCVWIKLFDVLAWKTINSCSKTIQQAPVQFWHCWLTGKKVSDLLWRHALYVFIVCISVCLLQKMSAQWGAVADFVHWWDQCFLHLNVVDTKTVFTDFYTRLLEHRKTVFGNHPGWCQHEHYPS